MNKTIRKFLLISWLFSTGFCFTLPQTAMGQVPGCTDPYANNYNSAATVNNGSCTYNSTAYTPAVKVNPLNDTLIETSGLQWAGNALWSFNDGGGDAAIYRIDSITNKILQRVYLQGTTNMDWEDIAFDGTYFYIGDFGNNNSGGRRDLVIYKFPFTAIPDHHINPVVTIPSLLIGRIEYTYSDQVQPAEATGFNNTNFDCEAMIVDSGMIHLFSKRWVDYTTTQYIISSTEPGSYIANAVANFATGYLVTAADKAPGQRLVVLLGYQDYSPGNHYMHLLSGYTSNQFFSGNKRKINLPNATAMGQAEGICFRNSSYGYISNEQLNGVFLGMPFTISPKLQSFDISQFVSGIVRTYIFSGNGNWTDAANWNDSDNPPPALNPGEQILIDPLPGGSCILNTAYTVPAGSALHIRNGKSFVVKGNLTLQ
jgi:hypothetical protein